MSLVAALIGCTATSMPPEPPEAPTVAPQETERPAPATSLPAAPVASSGEVPLDPAVKQGRLKNGLRYFIRENERPANRAELRLVVNAGSLQEDEDQLGLAHFVEHMAFNGTKNFEKQELVDYLEGIGMRFGPDLNAYTSFDETVYMLQLPTDEEDILAKGFDILEDWAHNISFDDEEIDKERGVVIEEWRSRQGAGSRIQDQQLPVTFFGSMYAERLPIGTVEILSNAPYQRLRDFYRDWYRPDLMAVVAVGDFDEAKIEATIKKHFSRIKPVAKPRARTNTEIPDHAETLVSIVSDPEATSSRVAVGWKRPPYGETMTLDALRQDVVDELYHNMMIGRLQELAQTADPPYQFAFAFDASLGRTKSIYRLVTSVNDGGVTRGLETMLVEAKRVRDHGFTSSELARGKENFLRGVERAYEERDKQESRSLVGGYVSFFLEGDPSPSVEFLRDFYVDAVPGVTIEEINARAEQWMTGGEDQPIEANRVILVSGPDTEAADLPSEAQLLAVFDEIDDVATTPWVDRTSDDPLVAVQPEPGKITSEETIPEVDATKWTLSNGIEVYLKTTDFKNDQILMAASSPGGHSLVSDEEFFNASQAGGLVMQMGLGSLGPIELGKKLTGKAVRIDANIGERQESVGGSASPKDLETLFQLNYLAFTAPRYDEVAFQSLKSRISGILENQKASPRYWFNKRQREEFFGDHPRRQGFEAEDVERMDAHEALRIYKERFADASDFKYFFVGNFELDEMRPLVERWLAGLPNLDREETWKDVNAYPATGARKFVVQKGLEPRAQVQLSYFGDTEWSIARSNVASAVGQALRIRLREVLREDLGGVYGVGVGTGISRLPRGRYSANIGFGTDPERVDELLAATQAAIDVFKSDGPSQEAIDKVKESWRRSRETQLEQNGFWLGVMQNYVEDERPWSDFDKFEQRLEAVTVESVRDFTRILFDDANVVEGRLVPEESIDAETGSGSDR